MGAVRTSLTCRRIAAHVLNAAMKQHQLGTKAHVFNPEMAEDWEVPSDWQIKALIDGRVVAEVDLVDDHALVTIQSWYDVIRTEHLAAFDPLDHGCDVDDGYHPVTEHAFPDAEYEIAYGDIPGLDSPERPMPRLCRGRRPRVISSR